MIVCIRDVLDSASLARARVIIDQGTFQDGRSTAGFAARLVKQNLQLSSAGSAHREMVKLIIERLRDNSMFQMVTLPKFLRPPLVSRCDPGMGYGVHVDDALMGDPATRADVSYTLFLSGPEQYEGGELILDDTEGEHRFKLPAGAMIIYPSTYLHRVETVKEGSRLVAVGWVQSLCRHAGQREILFDIQRLQRAEFERNGKSADFDLLAKTYSNLLRLFSDV